MNKTIQLFLLFLMGAASVEAQTITPYAGVTLSSNNVDLTADGVDFKVKPRVGFTVGANYEYQMGILGKGIFSVVGGIGFVQKGVTSDATVILDSEGEWHLDLYAEENYTINYLEVPVMAKYELGSDKLRYHFFAGPSIAYGLGGKYKANLSYNDEFYEPETVKGDIRFGNEPSENENDMYFDNRIDVGLQVGGGVNIHNKLSVDLKYGFGLSDLMDDTTSKNRAWQLTIGVPLALK